MERIQGAPAAVAFVAYLLAALIVGGRVPLIHLTMFRFSVPQGGTVTPYFRADGELASITGYTAFEGISPEAVDVAHRGFECSVEHKLYEQRSWIAENLAQEGEAEEATVRAEIGVHILSIGPDGHVRREDRVDAVGTARRRP